MPYASGTCRSCGEPSLKNRCASCARKHAAAEAARRAARKAEGACVVCGEPAAKTKHVGGKVARAQASLCKAHLAYYAERQRG